MKNKILVFAFVGSLTAASAQTFTIEGVNYKVTSAMDATEKTVEIAVSSCYTVEGGVFAPTTVNNDDTDYTITNIVTDAFNSCTNLTSVTLPNSVTSIGNTAFAACTNLTSIILPNSVTSIGRDAFNFCQDLTNVTLPNTLMGLAQSTFEDCTSLTSIILPNTLISIGASAFSNSGLTSITLPNSITSIGVFSFKNCVSLATFSINKANPLAINANVFEGLTLGDLTLKVPTAGVSAYTSAAVWSGFGTTEAIVILNTENHLKENAFSIAIHNNRLEITQADWTLKINKVQIINLLGQVVKTSKENSIALSNLPVGVYIVSVYTKNGRFSRKFVRE